MYNVWTSTTCVVTFRCCLLTLGRFQSRWGNGCFLMIHSRRLSQSVIFVGMTTNSCSKRNETTHKYLIQMCVCVCVCVLASSPGPIKWGLVHIVYACAELTWAFHGGVYGMTIMRHVTPTYRLPIIIAYILNGSYIIVSRMWDDSIQSLHFSGAIWRMRRQCVPGSLSASLRWAWERG